MRQLIYAGRLRHTVSSFIFLGSARADIKSDQDRYVHEDIEHDRGGKRTDRFATESVIGDLKTGAVG